MKESMKKTAKEPVKFGDKNVDLDEPDYEIDMSIGLPTEKVPEEAKRAKNEKIPKSNAVQLF